MTWEEKSCKMSDDSLAADRIRPANPWYSYHCRRMYLKTHCTRHYLYRPFEIEVQPIVAEASESGATCDRFVAVVEETSVLPIHRLDLRC